MIHMSSFGTLHSWPSKGLSIREKREQNFNQLQQDIVSTKVNVNHALSMRNVRLLHQAYNVFYNCLYQFTRTCDDLMHHNNQCCTSTASELTSYWDWAQED